MALRPQLQDLLDRSRDQRKKAQEEFSRLKPNQLSWTPGPGRWTIAQTLDHLNKTAELTLPQFEEALSKAEPAGNEGEETIRFRFSERIFIMMACGNGPVPVPVPPMFEPDPSPTPVKVVKRFFELNDAIRRLIERADEFRLKPLKVVSPVTARLRPGFAAYLEVAVGHEAYHLGQITTLIKDVYFPK